MRSPPLRALLPVVLAPLVATACLGIPTFDDATGGGSALGDAAAADGAIAADGASIVDAASNETAPSADDGAPLATPTPVRSAPGYVVTDLKVRGASLFWIETGSTDARAMRCALPACSSAFMITSGSAIHGVAPSSDAAYVLEDATSDVALTSYTLDGVVQATLVNLIQMTGPAEVDDSGFVFFTFPTVKDGPLRLGKREQSCNGCSQAWVVTPTNPQVSMQIVDGSVYWTEATQLLRCPTGGTGHPTETATTLVQGRTSLGGLAVGGGSVYWADTAAGSILRCATSLDDCSAAPPIASGQARPLRVAVDADRVSWVNGGNGAGDGTVMTCAAPDCAGGARPLAKGQAHPTEIATDGASVFWSVGGTILRVPK